MRHHVPEPEDRPAPSAAPAPGGDPHPQEPPPLPEDLASALRRGEHWIQHELGRPGVGAIAVGAALLAAASAVGVSETLVGAFGAYAVYRLLRRRRAEHGGQRPAPAEHEAS